MPPINHKQLSPEAWLTILQKAIKDFHTNRADPEAYQAIQDASSALQQYDADEGKPVLSPLMTGVQAGAETLGNIPQGIVQMANPVAALGTQVTSKLLTPIARAAGIKGDLISDEDIDRSEATVSNLASRYLDPANYLAPDESALVERSRKEHPRAAALGPIGAIAALPIIAGANRIYNSRTAKTNETIRGLRLQNEGYELENQIRKQKIARPPRETNPDVEENVKLRNEKLRRDLAAVPDAEKARATALANQLKEARLKSGAPQPGLGEAQLHGRELQNELLERKLGKKKPKAGGPAQPFTPHDITTNLKRKKGGQGGVGAKGGTGPKTTKPTMSEAAPGTPDNPLSSVSHLTDEELAAAHPLGAQPPLEESAMNPVERRTTAGPRPHPVDIERARTILAKVADGGTITMEEKAFIDRLREQQGLPPLTAKQWRGEE